MCYKFEKSLSKIVFIFLFRHKNDFDLQYLTDLNVVEMWIKFYKIEKCVLFLLKFCLLLDKLMKICYTKFKHGWNIMFRRRKVSMEKTILIADDNKEIVDLLKIYAQKEGYQYICAYDGEQALKFFKERNPSLILQNSPKSSLNTFPLLAVASL